MLRNNAYAKSTHVRCDDALLNKLEEEKAFQAEEPALNPPKLLHPFEYLSGHGPADPIGVYIFSKRLGYSQGGTTSSSGPQAEKLLQLLHHSHG